MNLYVSLYVVPADEFLDTQSTDKLIVPSMTLHVPPYILPGYKTFTTQSTPIWILHRMTHNISGMVFHVYCLVIPEAPSEDFIHQKSSLPPKSLQQGQNTVQYCWPPSAYSIDQESFHSPSWRLNMARILFCNAGLPWTIPSTSNHHFFPRTPLTGPGL